MSSKFSSPFLKKSPLLGAYTSGADGMVTVSYNDIHQKFQDDLAENVARAYTKEKSPCDDLDQKLSENKITNAAHATLSKKCAEKNKNKDSDTGSFESVTGKKPFEVASVSDYKKSNKTNPYYTGQGYESPYTIDLPEL